MLLHWLGYPIQLNENAKMGAVVVAVSFARSYWLRRIFNIIVFADVSGLFCVIAVTVILPLKFTFV